MMNELKNLRVAVIATDGFEETELTEPVHALRNAGAMVDILALHTGSIQAFKHHDKSITVPVDRLVADTQADAYGALLLPGGALNTDALRVDPHVQGFVRRIQQQGKPIALICHAAWILISAGLVEGRKLTSYHTIQDDIKNAGGNWVNREVVTDDNWVSSRQPSDIPAFNRAMLELFAERVKAGRTG